MRLEATTCLTLCLFLFAHHLSADSLDDLPPRWQQKLQPVLQVDISPLKSDEQAAVNEKRTQLGELLSTVTDTRLLASEYGKLGNLYLTHDLYTSADACYNNAILLDPGHFPWLYYSGYLAQVNGNLEAALMRYEQATELDPEYLPARYRLAQVHLDLNHSDKAFALYTSLLNEPGYRAAAHYGLGQVSSMKQDYHGAIDHFSSALELEPDARQIHYPLALALRASGNMEQAKQHLQQLGKREITINDPLVESLEALKNPASRHFVSAMSAVLKKEYSKAISNFQKGLEFNPDNSAARTSYARVLYLNNNRNEARTQLETVITSDPDKTLAIFLLALLEDEADNKEKAAELYQRVIEINSKHEGAHFFLGSYYLAKNDYKNAIWQYQAVTAVNEKNIPAQALKLVAMMGNGNPDRELLDLTRQIIERAPNALAIQRIQILLLATSDDANVRNAPKALEKAEIFYKKQPFPVNQELVALTLASAGNFDAAAEQLRQAIEAEQQYSKSKNIIRMKENLSMLEQHRLPAHDWDEDIRNMQPPPVNALTSFRDYPDANPI
ncbi:MAG: tetratricopeptide repeat protein [Gammaproteobacteria bacterium]|nr:tetratricopeptide repeat protein [Gammaproteobacteria bacterium]